MAFATYDNWCGTGAFRLPVTVEISISQAVYSLECGDQKLAPLGVIIGEHGNFGTLEDVLSLGCKEKSLSGTRLTC